MYMFRIVSLVGVLVTISEITAQNETTSTEIVYEYTDITDSLEEFTELCLSFNLRVASPIVNAPLRTITLDFELAHPRFQSCFQYFYIYLKKNERIVATAMVPFDYAFAKATYTFENVTYGSYNIVIRPCINRLQCSEMYINFPRLVNMTSIDSGIEPPVSSMSKATFYKHKRAAVITITFFLIALFLLICALIYRHYYLVRLQHRNKMNVFIENGISTSDDDKIGTEIIQVYLLHYYDNSVERKVELLKDFLLKSSYFNVIQIEDELPEIFLDQDLWLNKVLEFEQCHAENKRKKIVIVDSEEPKNVEEYENENRVLCEIIKKLQRDWTRSLNDYDNIFVIHFNGAFTKSKELEYIVKRDRYCIPDHLIDLCINLMHGSKIVTLDIEEHLKQILVQHPIRNFDLMKVV